MKIVNYSRIEAKDIEGKGAEGVKIRWLITGEDGAQNFAMRHFEIAPGGHTPFHEHEWEHEVFILSGEGIVREGDKEHRITAGDVIFAPAYEEHQFINTGTGTFSFLCLIPMEK